MRVQRCGLRKVTQHLKVRDHHKDHTWDISPGFAALEAAFNVDAVVGQEGVREEKFAPADSPFNQ
jgi:hypothetical protein